MKNLCFNESLKENLDRQGGVNNLRTVVGLGR